LIGDREPVAEEIRHPQAAIGCVLARAVRSARALPPRAVAFADGWAVAATDTFAASAYSPVAISQAHPVRIGDPVPDHCDAVVPTDAVVVDRGQPTIQTPLAAGDNIRRIGEDAAEGELLLAAGRPFTPLGATLAGLAGVERVVVRVPRVHIFHVDPQGIAPAHLTATALTRLGLGCRIADVEEMGDMALAETLPHVTIIIGGVALGPRDPILARLVAQEGWQGLGRPAMRPGEWVVCGLLDDRPVILMPSSLDSVLASLLLILRPLALMLAGGEDLSWRQQRLLSRKIASAVGFTELVLLGEADGGCAWKPIGVGSFDWMECASASAFVEIGPESEGVAEGEAIEATMLVGPGACGLWSEA
jgi:molybdopterin biosynthesis enzyme